MLRRLLAFFAALVVLAGCGASVESDQDRCERLVGLVDALSIAPDVGELTRFADDARPLASGLADGALRLQWSAGVVDLAGRVASEPSMLRPYLHDALYRGITSGMRLCSERYPDLEVVRTGTWRYGEG